MTVELIFRLNRLAFDVLLMAKLRKSLLAVLRCALLTDFEGGLKLLVIKFISINRRE